MRKALDHLRALERYTAASEQAASQIIGVYSTSFGTATRLLGPRHRAHVRNIYALVRVADELVDGATAEAGIDLNDQHAALDHLEEETERALQTGYSSNPIVHAFAHTARASGITTELTRPFFASMRSDLAPKGGTPHRSRGLDAGEHAAYVYGSAEVVGLMCLRVFVRSESYTTDEMKRLELGARQLGAAFQNVNFLRDLADDTARLGRSYLSEKARLSEAEHHQWVAMIREQLAAAQATLPLLPRDARLAVTCAMKLFEKLTDRIAATPAAALYERRISVPAHEKAILVTQAALSARRERAA